VSTHPDMPPWVDGTEGNEGAILILDDMMADDVVVRVDGEGRPAGTLVQIRWFGVGDGVSPTPPFETPWQHLNRANAPQVFRVPIVEANLRPGTVLVMYTALFPDGTALASPARTLTVAPATSLLPLEVPDALENEIYPGLTAGSLPLMAPRQPWLVPPGSEVTFFWELLEAFPDRGRGWDGTVMPDASAAMGSVPAAALLRAVGCTLAVHYTVDTYAGDLAIRHLRSAAIALHVVGKGLTYPAPHVPGATAGLVALDAFARGVPVNVAIWPGIREGQLVWITLEGTSTDGTCSYQVVEGAPISSSEVVLGVATSIPVGVLSTLLDGSNIELYCEVAFNGQVDGNRTAFPSASYTLVHAGAARGRAVEREPFDGAIALRAGETQRMRFFSIACVAGQTTAQTAAYNNPQFTGTYLTLATAGSEIEIRLDQAAMQLEINMAIGSASYPGHVATYDLHGEVLETRHVLSSERVRFTAANTEKRIAAARITSSTNQGVSFDDVVATSGHPWNEMAERFTETFNDLPMGEHGEVFAFERWSISTDGGQIAITPDPGSNQGTCLAIRTTPAGRTHYFTPHFGLRPRSRIALRMRTSGSSAHKVVVDVVYVNTADLTLRVVQVSANLSASFSTLSVPANQLPDDLEYVSHLRIVHDTGSAITAVLYDDLTFE
jgi:hypothetical protein